MSASSTPFDTLTKWVSQRPYWEQYIWKLNFEKDALNTKDIEQCYEYLCEDLGLIPNLPDKPAISFNISARSEKALPNRINLAEVKSFKNVNALSETCSIKTGSHLTLIYGINGSGKSGVGRLLCNACFSRGNREILPNVKKPADTQSPPQAVFKFNDGTEIIYSLGEKHERLSRFSVFDGESVLIHLDESNSVSFTPPQIKIFDQVANTIGDMENALRLDNYPRVKTNPFDPMFLAENEKTRISEFCKTINFATKDEEFLKYANFDEQTDGQKISDLENQINEKKKLDVAQKKKQLIADRQNLSALKESLSEIFETISTETIEETNKLTTDILDRQSIIKSNGIQTFDDGILTKIGSSEWKSLIIAAKKFYEIEKAADGGKDPSHCILCHQKLSKESAALFEKYWQFLQSKAEVELQQLVQSQSRILEGLKKLLSRYPRFLNTDAGVRILTDEEPAYFDQLKTQFQSIETLLERWPSLIQDLKEVPINQVPIVNLDTITTLIDAKAIMESKLVDPSGAIADLTAQLRAVRHKKEATAVKNAALEYLAYLRWHFKAHGVNFSGIKAAITKKRTEYFQQDVARLYKEIFNEELAALGCEFNLEMRTSGDQGNTVKEYHLDFAKDYSPSQILSQGEQNVCALADFLTETQLDPTNCGIIFDDPVTSLDQLRKDKISERLVLEANKRQVIVFTHDLVFLSQLFKHAAKHHIPALAHWMRKIAGVPGHVDENTSPKTATVSTLKNNSHDAVSKYESLGPKEQERALGAAFDYLRSACEALIEDVLFANAIQRYEDQIRVQNLEEAVFDRESALRIIDLHGRLSEVLLGHNRSDTQREKPLELDDLLRLSKEFDELENQLKELKKISRKAKETRKEEKKQATAGWK